MVHTHLGPDRQRALALAKDPLKEYMRSSLSLFGLQSATPTGAGGTAGPYQRLVRALAARGRDAVAPGRGRGADDPPCRSVAEAVDHPAGVVTRDFEHGCALFGHGMGGLLTFETARELERLGRPAASWVGVRAASAPPLRPWLPRRTDTAGATTGSLRTFVSSTAYVRELGGVRHPATHVQTRT